MHVDLGNIKISLFQALDRIRKKLTLGTNTSFFPEL